MPLLPFLGRTGGPAKSGVPFSSPALKLPRRKLFEELNGFSHSNILLSQNTNLKMLHSLTQTIIKSELYVILEAVADHVEMHHNIGDQRDNWNSLLLNSIDMITLASSTMVGVARFAAAASGSPLLSFKLSSGLLFSAAMGMLVIMNKIQLLQLAKEQRNATRLFRSCRTRSRPSSPSEKSPKKILRTQWPKFWLSIKLTHFLC